MGWVGLNVHMTCVYAPIFRLLSTLSGMLTNILSLVVMVVTGAGMVQARVPECDVYLTTIGSTSPAKFTLTTLLQRDVSDLVQLEYHFDASLASSCLAQCLAVKEFRSPSGVGTILAVLRSAGVQLIRLEHRDHELKYVDTCSLDIIDMPEQLLDMGSGETFIVVSLTAEDRLSIYELRLPSFNASQASITPIALSSSHVMNRSALSPFVVGRDKRLFFVERNAVFSIDVTRNSLHFLGTISCDHASSLALVLVEDEQQLLVYCSDGRTVFFSVKRQRELSVSATRPFLCPLQDDYVEVHTAAMPPFIEFGRRSHNTVVRHNLGGQLLWGHCFLDQGSNETVFAFQDSSQVALLRLRTSRVQRVLSCAAGEGCRRPTLHPGGWLEVDQCQEGAEPRCSITLFDSGGVALLSAIQVPLLHSAVLCLPGRVVAPTNPPSTTHISTAPLDAAQTGAPLHIILPICLIVGGLLLVTGIGVVIIQKIHKRYRRQSSDTNLLNYSTDSTPRPSSPPAGPVPTPHPSSPPTSPVPTPRPSSPPSSPAPTPRPSSTKAGSSVMVERQVGDGETVGPPSRDGTVVAVTRSTRPPPFRDSATTSSEDPHESPSQTPLPPRPVSIAKSKCVTGCNDD